MRAANASWSPCIARLTTNAFAIPMQPPDGAWSAAQRDAPCLPGWDCVKTRRGDGVCAGPVGIHHGHLAVRDAKVRQVAEEDDLPAVGRPCRAPVVTTRARDRIRCRAAGQLAGTGAIRVDRPDPFTAEHAVAVRDLRAVGA